MEPRDPSLPTLLLGRPPPSAAGARSVIRGFGQHGLGLGFPAFCLFFSACQKQGDGGSLSDATACRERPDHFPLYLWVHRGPRRPGTGPHSAALRPGKRSQWLHSSLARMTRSGRFYRPPLWDSPEGCLSPVITGKNFLKEPEAEAKRVGGKGRSFSCFPAPVTRG